MVWEVGYETWITAFWIVRGFAPAQSWVDVFSKLLFTSLGMMLNIPKKNIRSVQSNFSRKFIVPWSNNVSKRKEVRARHVKKTFSQIKTGISHNFFRDVGNFQDSFVLVKIFRKTSYSSWSEPTMQTRKRLEAENAKFLYEMCPNGPVSIFLGAWSTFPSQKKIPDQ